MAAGMERYLDELRAAGALGDAALAGAFRAVPREIFVSSGFHRAGGWVAPADPGFLDAVYSDSVLVTKVRDGEPVSSSSQPSLMARMLAALDVRPGLRVLEIGAGTGYNAALLAALGASVTSVEVQRDVADAAASALARAGVTGARVRLGDGYAGAPDLAPFDRIIVTAGIGGLSAAWADQLAPDGLIVAPIGHGGIQPVMTARRGPSGWWARPVCAAGFMIAAGSLSAPHSRSAPPPIVLPRSAVTVRPGAASSPAGAVPPAVPPSTGPVSPSAGAASAAASPSIGAVPPAVAPSAGAVPPAAVPSISAASSPAGAVSPSAGAEAAEGELSGGGRAGGPARRRGLTGLEYHDLWFAAAVWDVRVTAASALVTRGLGGFGLHEPGPPASAAGLLPDGRIRADGPAGPRLVRELAALVERWRRAGAPGLERWTVTLAPAGDAGRPIWAPHGFTLAS